MAATLKPAETPPAPGRVGRAYGGVKNLGDSLAALGLALLGGGIGAVVLFAEPIGARLFGWENPFLVSPAKDFVALPETQLWLFGLGAQVALLAVLFVPAVRMSRELRSERATAAAFVGLLLIGAVVAVFQLISNSVRPAYPFPHHDAKLTVILVLGLLTCAPAILTIWRVHGALNSQFGAGAPADPQACLAFLRTLDRTQEGQEGNPVAGFLRLRELVHRSLLVLGTIIGGAILDTGALRLACNTFFAQADYFPIEYVLLYGGFFSLVLVTIYLPTYNRLQLAGRWLVEHYTRFCEPDSPDWDTSVAKRTQLIALLQLELSLTGSLQAGAAILAPLATALVGLLLPGA
jgi:hypothetical protein